MKHPLRCRCGTLKGEVDTAGAVARLVCYCRDCQAFAHFLGRPADTLDALGGTDIVGAKPRAVSFTAGREALACMSLSDTGLFRWYARCCHTPIGNTPRNVKVAYVGLIHTCFDTSASTLDNSFGPVRMHTGTQSAKRKPAASPLGVLSTLPRFAASMIGARLVGSWKHTPFFDPALGTPVITPRVLSPAERQQLSAAL